jgi:hypothetical protein
MRVRDRRQGSELRPRYGRRRRSAPSLPTKTSHYLDWHATGLADADEKRQRTGAIQDAHALAVTPEFIEALWSAVARRSRDTAFERAAGF